MDGFCCASTSAFSSSTAEPEPLSLMPGPAETESRCAPNMVTWSDGPPGQSAIRLFEVYEQEVQVCSETW